MTALAAETLWITGASRGIGYALAKECVAQGARVVLSARSRDRLRTIAAELAPKALAVPCDVTDPAQVEAAYQHIRSAGWQLTGLINNAGIATFAPFAELSMDAMRAMVHTNLLGAMYCTAVILPELLERRCGSIVNILSVAAVTPFQNAAVYGATKAGLQMFADVLRAEVRAAGIRVINILPGATATEIWDSQMLEQYQHRMMDPASVARAVCALLALPPDAHPETLVLRPQMGDL